MNRSNRFAGGGYWIGNSFTFSGLILFSWMGLLWCCCGAETLYGQEDTAQLQQAQIHQKEGRFAEAEMMYLDLINQNPESEEAREARTHLAVLYVAWDKPDLAQNAYEMLAVDFTEFDRLAQAVRTIAYDCLRLKKPEKVLAFYKNVLDEYPEDNLAIWSHMGTILSNINMGDPNTAEIATQELLTNYAEHRDVAEVASLVAWNYRQENEPLKAQPLYQFVVTNHPKAERAIYAHRGLVYTHFALDDPNEAWSETESLSVNYADDVRITEVVLQIAGKFRVRKDYAQSRSLNQWLLDNYPQSEQALWAQRGMVLCDIGLNNTSAVQNGITKLKNDFAWHPDIAKAVYQVASKLERIDDPQALNLYQYILSTKPADDRAVQSQANMGVISLRLEKDQAAEIIFSKVISSYAENPILPQAVALMADGYYSKAFTLENQGNGQLAFDYFRKAIDKWELIALKLPETPHTTAEAYKMAADCYRRMGNYHKAIQYYQEVATRWPKYQYAWHAQYLIGNSYERLKKARSLPAKEANAKTQIAYERLLQIYPDCSTAKVARRWLNRRSQ